MSQKELPIVIAGGGIGGLAMALTLHQIGLPCIVLESVVELRPLGVGINIQPNAVRELYEMGFGPDELNTIGVQTKEWALVGLNGKEIYSEPRGHHAGYNWPQYSVHRGQLQMLLLEAVQQRIGKDAVRCGQRVVSYTNHDAGVTVVIDHHDGQQSTLDASILIAADGLHSAVRQTMYPDQPPIQWGGAIMWRGTARGKPIRTDASFIGLGTHHHRMVVYPISQTDDQGEATINWIAEITVDNSHGWTQGDWNRKVDLNEFIHHFEDWNYEWLDVPAMLRSSDAIFEYPMIDRDPVASWRDGNVILIGDAAHVMYPVGSNGASQAIVDARCLGAMFIKHGCNAEALRDFDETYCGPVSQLILRNRGAGPFGILNLVDDRCGGVFENIDDVVSKQELEEFMHNYKSAAGFAMDALNNAPSIIAEDSTC